MRCGGDVSTATFLGFTGPSWPVTCADPAEDRLLQ
jgi:hypothetical protein